MDSPFSVTRDGPVAILTHDDGKANTFVEATFVALRRTLEEIDQSDAGAVLYRGRPGYFSAGLNLKALPNLSHAGFVSLLEQFGRAVMDVFTFPRPVVAEVTGHAIGAGAMFVFAADSRYFNTGAWKFGLNEVPNGMPVPSYGVEVARSALRMSDQLELVCHGRMLNPEQALELRLASATAEDTHPLALERAHALSALPSGVYGITKRNLRGAQAGTVLATLAAEADRFVTALGR